MMVSFEGALFGISQITSWFVIGVSEGRDTVSHTCESRVVRVMQSHRALFAFKFRRSAHSDTFMSMFTISDVRTGSIFVNFRV